MNNSFSSFFLTPGDLDGVGLEVSLKALQKLKHEEFFKKNLVSIYIWHKPEQVDFIKSFFSDFKSISDQAFSELFNYQSEIIFIESNLNPAQWFVKSIESCIANKASGIVTGPMSKQEIYSLGFNDIGHTDVLKRLCYNQNFHMGFVGSKFNVTLYTDHKPINQIALDKNSFKNFIDLSLNFDKAINSHVIDKIKPTLLGFNPHAGDQGIIGHEDDIIKQWLLDWNLTEILNGPIPADTAFTGYQTSPNKTFFSIYHDQGLIPFKMAHGFSGYQTTLGLPFIRTSVDHGTAKNIFNNDRADFTSMYDAIYGAYKIWKGQK